MGQQTTGNIHVLYMNHWMCTFNFYTYRYSSQFIARILNVLLKDQFIADRTTVEVTMHTEKFMFDCAEYGIKDPQLRPGFTRSWKVKTDVTYLTRVYTKLSSSTAHVANAIPAQAHYEKYACQTVCICGMMH